MRRRSWYEIIFRSDSDSGSMIFFAMSVDDARYQFVGWWYEYFGEHLPLPQYHFRATYSAENCAKLDAIIAAK